jgi:SAM-dependent methyltransferase
MDESTQRYYSAHAAELSALYELDGAEVEGALRRAFVRGMKVLDIGAASGRDMQLLDQLGCDSYGVEPCDELREIALKRHPEFDGRLQSGMLPFLGLPFEGIFDGVLCSAVLMHLPRAEMVDAAIALRDLLKDNGRLLVSVPARRPGLDEDSRDVDGRLFTMFQPDHLQLLFERVGFLLIDRWESPDGLRRDGHSWWNLVLQAQHPGGPALWT